MLIGFILSLKVLSLKASPLPPAPLALLKCVLARWLLVARFLAFLRPDLRFMVPMGVIWHAWCLYFGVLEVPGTILGRSWDIGGHKEGPCEVQAWILSIFW